MAFEIVTDSSCNLPDEMIKEYGLHILPLQYMVDGKQYPSYQKDTETDYCDFYKMLSDGKIITTSLPNISNSEEILREILEKGDDILYIGFSSSLSGTFDSTKFLLQTLSKEFPNQKLISIDTLAASMGEGLLIHYAVKEKQHGKSIDEVAKWVEEHKCNIAHWFTVNDLMYLHRGGRVSKTSAVAGTVLQIKPILNTDSNGFLAQRETVRGRKKALKRLVEIMQETALKPIDQQDVFITHGNCLDDAKYVANLIEEQMGVKNFTIHFLEPVIAAHCGPGTIGLFFLAGQRDLNTN